MTTVSPDKDEVERVLRIARASLLDRIPIPVEGGYSYLLRSDLLALAAMPDVDNEAKLLSYDHAHEIAVEMGYPSLTEALEHLDELRGAGPPPVEGEVERLRDRIRILVWNREKAEGNSDQGAMNAVEEELAALLSPEPVGEGE